MISPLVWTTTAFLVLSKILSFLSLLGDAAGRFGVSVSLQGSFIQLSPSLTAAKSVELLVPPSSHTAITPSAPSSISSPSSTGPGSTPGATLRCNPSDSWLSFGSDPLVRVSQLMLRASLFSGFMRRWIILLHNQADPKPSPVDLAKRGGLKIPVWTCLLWPP